MVKALFLSRSRPVMLEAWQVLQLAVSSDDAGLVNVLDAQSFARLLPLLGEQLNEAKVEQLFGAIDADDSGTIEFDEFVKVIQMLHPLQATRRSAAEQAASPSPSP